jgi:hypothetical protein
VKAPTHSPASSAATTLAFLGLLTRRFLPPGPKLAARRLEIVGGEKKNPARENSRTDKSLCNGTSLAAVHLARVAGKFQENTEIMVFPTVIPLRAGGY